MPHMAPKSLSNNDVYALTAYILYLNDLVDENAVMTKDNLPRIEMPGRARSVDLFLGE
jgi:cytochrome c